MTDLGAVADALYAELPARFIAERGAAVKRAKSDGDRSLADEIGRLTKPTVAAWALNALVRQRPEVMEQFLSLGETLREAQEDLDSDALRGLVQQRRALVSGLGAEAAKLGDELGHSVGPAAREDIEQTLQAALADADAAEALMTGRLVRSLETTGFDPVDLDGAVGGGAVEEGRGARRPVAQVPAKGRAREQNDIDRARAKRDKELAERTEEKAVADRARRDAEESLTAAQTALDEATEERDGLRDAVADLQKQLDETEQRLNAATSETRRALTRRDDADDRAARAVRNAERAEERLAALQRRR